MPSLLLDDFFAGAVRRAEAGWRRTVGEAVRLGIPVPAYSSALAFYDGYRSRRLPANLIQAQRDFFGAHTYERTDRPRGEFHHLTGPERGRHPGRFLPSLTRRAWVSDRFGRNRARREAGLAPSRRAAVRAVLLSIQEREASVAFLS